MAARHQFHRSLAGNRRGARSKRSRAPARRGDRGRQRDNYRTGRSRSHYLGNMFLELYAERAGSSADAVAGGVVHHLGRAPLSRAGNCPEPRQPARSPIVSRNRTAASSMPGTSAAQPELPRTRVSSRAGDVRIHDPRFTIAGRLPSPQRRRRAPGDPAGRRRRPSAGSPARPDTAGRHRPG